MIVGFSTRAIAESAARAGLDVITLDYFGDRDQQALVENTSLLRDHDLPYTADGLVEVGRAMRADALVYTASLENHPQTIVDLSCGRELLGNGPDVLRQVRDWRVLRTFCTEADIPFAETLLAGEEGRAQETKRYLRKPVRSGGGHGIDVWDRSPLDETHMLQGEVHGLPASAAFVADGVQSQLIGVTEQLIGRTELGASGFTWCGNILPVNLHGEQRRVLWERIADMASQLTRRFGLRGVNGLDVVISEGEHGGPCPILVEVNPRYTASMELIEQARDLPIAPLHIEAAQHGVPGELFVEPLEAQAGFFGKAIVYAQSGVVIPETSGWTERGRRDVPHPGERIEAGHPVCTVFAEGEEREMCWEGLLDADRAVRREIGDQMGGRP